MKKLDGERISVMVVVAQNVNNELFSFIICYFFLSFFVHIMSLYYVMYFRTQYIYIYINISSVHNTRIKHKTFT